MREDKPNTEHIGQSVVAAVLIERYRAIQLESVLLSVGIRFMWVGVLIATATLGGNVHRNDWLAIGVIPPMLLVLSQFTMLRIRRAEEIFREALVRLDPNMVDVYINILHDIRQRQHSYHFLINPRSAYMIETSAWFAFWMLTASVRVLLSGHLDAMPR